MKIQLLITLGVGLAAGVFYYFYVQKPKQAEPLSRQFSPPLKDDLRSILFRALNQNYPDLDFQIDRELIVSEKAHLIIRPFLADQKTREQGVLCQINFYLTHPLLHSEVEDRLLGAGEGIYSALENGVSNYLDGQFPVILSALQMQHEPEMDVDIIGEHGAVHWHPILGTIQLQGELSSHHDPEIYEKTYQLLFPFFAEKLKNSKEDFHWFRYYISRMPDGEFIGDCYFDNVDDPEGLEILQRHVASWPFREKFAGQKQFIMFRKCPK